MAAPIGSIVAYEESISDPIIGQSDLACHQAKTRPLSRYSGPEFVHKWDQGQDKGLGIDTFACHQAIGQQTESTTTLFAVQG